MQAASPHDCSHILGDLRVIPQVFLQLGILAEGGELLVQEGARDALVRVVEDLVQVHADEHGIPED